MTILIVEKLETFTKELDEFCIYNRFDLRYKDGNVFYRITDGDNTYYLPCHIMAKEALLGLWLNPISADIVEKVCNSLFEEYSVEKIHYEYYPNVIKKKCDNHKTNHWKVDIPSSSEELDARLSRKKRYNLRREKKIVQSELGIFQISEYESHRVPDKIINTYFEYKNASHQSEYHMTPTEYLQNYYVSHVYTLEFANEIGAILLACEQGEAVYLENLTYNPKYKKYSLGSILYDEYLKILIQKGKAQLFLGSGQQEYKSYYGAIEQVVYDGTIYRNRIRFCREVTIPSMMKRMIHDIRIVCSKIKRKANIKARIKRCSLRLREWINFRLYDLQHMQMRRQLERFRDKTQVMICAHPDDETVFFYDVLRKNPSILVICLSNASNPTRNKEFYNAMQELGTDSLIFNMEDSDSHQYSWNRKKLVRILQQIRLVISPKIVYTHNRDGEYGHPHHKMVHCVVKDIFSDSEIWVAQRTQNIVCEHNSEKKAFCRRAYPSQNVCEWFSQYIEFEGIEKGE